MGIYILKHVYTRTWIYEETESEGETNRYREGGGEGETEGEREGETEGETERGDEGDRERGKLNTNTNIARDTE